jgi:putative transposase
VPRGLKRYYQHHHLHFITFSCYRRMPLLGSPRRRDALLRHIEAARRKFRFAVIGYVVMPEHVHLLIAPPEAGDPSVVIKSLKLRSARAFLKPRLSRQAELFERRLMHFWQKRFYDFNVYSEKKRIEKLKYMHGNPVKRGLVSSPDEWKWSSYRFYMHGERNTLEVTKFEELPDLPFTHLIQKQD